METWELALWLSALVIVIPIGFLIYWFFSSRRKKNFLPEEPICTRPPKSLSAFFLSFAFLWLYDGTAGIVYFCITDSEHMPFMRVFLAALCVVALSALAVFAYMWIRFNYVVADNEGIYVYRLFRKHKYYRYEEICYFADTLWKGMRGGLIGYDINNKKIFVIETVQIGSTAVAQRLREHGVVESSRR
ncbi:MAG: hypothetical protein K2J30_00880 [Clostridia bacterium]|nr:hypothetical protein [Clostridia bacterium]